MSIADQRLPADLAKSVLDGRDISILSDGSPTRTFCYVSDAVTGYILCLLHGKYDCFNIGTDEQEIQVREMAEVYRATGAELFGYSGRVTYGESIDPEYLIDNPSRRCPDISKARKELGYAPEVRVKEGVRRYLQFLKNKGLGET
jgi:UDP-glucuronate decarboxylase